MNGSLETLGPSRGGRKNGEQKQSNFCTGGRTEVTDTELDLIAAGGRIEDEMKVIPPPSKD